MDYLTRANQIVGIANHLTEYEGSLFSINRGPERVPEVNELRSEIKRMGVFELNYFEEGLDCIQYAQASRAAIVLGWVGYIDLLQKKIAYDNFISLNNILRQEFPHIYKKLNKIKTINDLAKFFDDSLLLQAGKKLGYFKSHVYTQLDSMRDERNNCAHVQEYKVNVRIALGFYAKLINYIPYVLYDENHNVIV